MFTYMCLKDDVSKKENTPFMLDFNSVGLNFFSFRFKAQSCPELNNRDRKPKCCVTFRLDQIWSTCYRETSVIHQGGAERKINSGVSAKMRQFRKKLSLKNLKRCEFFM